MAIRHKACSELLSPQRARQLQETEAADVPGDGIAALITRGQARRFLGALWAANAFFFIYNLLLAAGWKGGMNTFAKQLNLDNEACVASWYQSMLLFLLALAATGQWLTRLNAGRGSDRREHRRQDSDHLFLERRRPAPIA